MYDTNIKIIESMKRKKTDVEEYGDSSLKVFLTVMGIAYLSVFIWNLFG